MLSNLRLVTPSRSCKYFLKNPQKTNHTLLIQTDINAGDNNHKIQQYNPDFSLNYSFFTNIHFTSIHRLKNSFSQDGITKNATFHEIQQSPSDVVGPTSDGVPSVCRRLLRLGIDREQKQEMTVNCRQGL